MRSFKNKTNGQSGVALISVVIATTLMSMLALVAADMIDRQAQQVSYLEDKLSVLDLKNSLIGIMNNEAACTRNFKGKIPSANLTLQKLVDEGGGSILDSVGGKAAFDHIQISRIQLLNVSVKNKPSAGGRMSLKVSLKRERKGFGGVDLKPIEVGLIVQTNDSKRITACGGLAAGPLVGVSGTGSGSGSGGDGLEKDPRACGDDKEIREGSTFMREGYRSSSRYVCVNGVSVFLNVQSGTGDDRDD